jgi:hypothetical protein
MCVPVTHHIEFSNATTRVATKPQKPKPYCSDAIETDLRLGVSTGAILVEIVGAHRKSSFSCELIVVQLDDDTK